MLSVDPLSTATVSSCGADNSACDITPSITGYGGVLYVNIISTADTSRCGANDYACNMIVSAVGSSELKKTSRGSVILLQTSTHRTGNSGMSVYLH